MLSYRFLWNRNTIQDGDSIPKNFQFHSARFLSLNICHTQKNGFSNNLLCLRYFFACWCELTQHFFGLGTKNTKLQWIKIETQMCWPDTYLLYLNHDLKNYDYHHMWLDLQTGSPHLFNLPTLATYDYKNVTWCTVW